MSSRCRVALLGFGAVGSAVARRLTAPDAGASSNVQLTHAGAHSAERGIFGAGAGGATPVAVLSDIAALARDRAAIVPPPVLTADFRRQTSHFKRDRSLLAEAV